MPTEAENEKLAQRILDLEQTDLPITFSDVAREVAAHPEYEHNLLAAYHGIPAPLQFLIKSAALKLVETFNPE